MGHAEFRIESDGTGEGVDATAFLTVAKSLLLAVNGIGRNLDRSFAGARWEIVEASKQSPLAVTFRLTDRGRDVTGRDAVTRFASGLRRLQLFEGESPEYFDTRVVENIHRASNAAALHLADCRFRVNGSHVSLGSETRNAAAKLLAGPTSGFAHTAFASFEGTLVRVGVELGADAAHFALVTRAHGPVDCSFEKGYADNPIFEEAKKYLPHRVRAFGLASYDDKGNLARVVVRSLDKLDQEEELPLFSAMPPLNITDGADSAEHVRRVRDGGDT